MIYNKEDIDTDMISGICDWICFPTTYNLASFIYIADIPDNKYALDLLKLNGVSEITLHDYGIMLANTDIIRSRVDSAIMADILKYASRSPVHSLIYVKSGIEVKKNEMINRMATAPKESYLYARQVLRDRFELGEKSIATDAFYSYMYSRYVLHSRFKLGEPVINTDEEYSYKYDRDVIKRGW